MRFSVCIPTTRPNTIESAIRSILSQTSTDWELVVVGQGDQELLHDITMQAAGGDTRVRYIHIRRRGSSVARNAGIKSATGEIVAFMDDDCEADSRWLAELDKCFEPGIGFVSGNVVAPPLERSLFVDCCQVDVRERTYEPVSISAKLTDNDFPLLLGANMAVRREDAERVGFDECLGPGTAFGGGEEHDFAIRLMGIGVRMRSTPKASVQHTYGARYGWRAVYNVKRRRIYGDGAIAAKDQLRRLPSGGLSVDSAVWQFLKEQLSTVKILRLPNACLRLFHLGRSYRECLRGYQLSVPQPGEPMMGVLIPRADDAPRSTIGPHVTREAQTTLTTAKEPELL